MTVRGYGETPYTLQKLTIALNNLDGTFGTPVTWADGQMFTSEPEHDTDKMRGYGKNVRGLSVPVGCKVSLKGGGLDWTAFVIMTGSTSNLSGSTPNEMNQIRPQAGKNMPHFAVIGEVVTDDAGILIVGHEAIQLENIPAITADGESNKYVVSEASGYSFPQGDDLEFIEAYEDETDWTTPADAAAVAAFFA